MKKKGKSEMDDELRTEYDLRELLKGGVRGKYAERYRGWTNLVLLAPDVAEAFANDAEAVNEALRLVIQLTKVPGGKSGNSQNRSPEPAQIHTEQLGAPLTALAERGAANPSKTGSENSFSQWLQPLERPRVRYKSNSSLPLIFFRDLKILDAGLHRHDGKSKIDSGSLERGLAGC